MIRKSIVILVGVLAVQFLSSGYGQTAAPAIKDESFLVKILSPISASANKKGDKFTLQVLEPASYKDAMIEAEVVKAKAAGRASGKSELLFSFDKLTLKDGTAVPITADLKEVSNSKGAANVDDEGHVIGKSSTKKTVATTAALGGLGAVIGGIAGGGKGAAIGAAAGAAVGLTISFSTKGEDIKFAPGSQFKLVVNSAAEQKK
jgi:hypothetical protein